MIILASLTAVLVAFALTATNQPMTIVSLLLMGGFGFATVPGLQLRIMSHAQDAPTMASGSNIAAFNVGNALGAWLGGLAIAAGFGFTSPLWVGGGRHRLPAWCCCSPGHGGEWPKRPASELLPAAA